MQPHPIGADDLAFLINLACQHAIRCTREAQRLERMRRNECRMSPEIGRAIASRFRADAARLVSILAAAGLPTDELLAKAIDTPTDAGDRY